jgi:hypothetical protein
MAAQVSILDDVSDLRRTALASGRNLALGLVAAFVGLVLLGGPAQAATAFSPAATFNCAAANGDGTYTYFFGYSLSGNSPVTIPIGPNNQFTSSNNTLADSFAYGGKQDLGQPTTFTPGQHANAFSVTTSDTTLTWHLAQGHVKVDSSSLCANVPVVAEAPGALVLPLATAAPFAIWFLTMHRRSRRSAA